MRKTWSATRWLALSLALHAIVLVAVGLVARRWAPREDAAAEEPTIELEVAAPEAVDVAPVPEASPAETSQSVAEQPDRRAATAERSRARRAVSVAPRAASPGEGQPAAQGDGPAAPSDEAPAPSPTDRFGSFGARPGPNLALNLPPPPEAPIDPLVGHPLPQLRRGKPAGPPLGKTVRGESGVVGQIAEDGTLTMKGPSALRLEGGGLAFDATDAVLGSRGADPYKEAKRRLADATREARLCLAREAHLTRSRQALAQLTGRLQAILARRDLSSPERRRVVFELWDECREGDDDPGGFGAAARATILAVIRRAFPAGSADAYPPAEVAALNRDRSSRAPFDPYNPVVPGRATEVEAASD